MNNPLPNPGVSLTKQRLKYVMMSFLLSCLYGFCPQTKTRKKAKKNPDPKTWKALESYRKWKLRV